MRLFILVDAVVLTGQLYYLDAGIGIDPLDMNFKSRGSRKKRAALAFKILYFFFEL